MVKVDGEVGVKLHLRQAAHPERREAEVVLQIPELSFHGTAFGTAA